MLHTVTAAVFLIFISSGIIILSILFFIYTVFIILLYPLYFSLMHLLYSAKTGESETVFARTSDGWDLAMHRYTPDRITGKYPVIFLHGIFVNRFSVDISPDLSLANYLKNSGYEVFVPDLRGKGSSAYRKRMRAPDYSFDDFAEKDGPALLEEALKLTGAKKLHWIGHSMGGMIGYSLAASTKFSKNISSMVSIAGPGKSDFIQTASWASMIKLMHLTPLINLKFFARIMIPFAGIFNIPPENFIYSRDNLSKKTIKMLLMNAVENTSPLLLRQLTDWIESGKEVSLDGKNNYAAVFKKIKIPSLYLAGMKDHIAVPESIAHAYHNTAGKNKKFILLGREYSKTADYCHMGMVIGENARKEVFPLILKWIKTYENINGKVLNGVKKRK